MGIDKAGILTRECHRNETLCESKADNDERPIFRFAIKGATAYAKECETAKSVRFPALGVSRKSGLAAGLWFLVDSCQALTPRRLRRRPLARSLGAAVARLRAARSLAGGGGGPSLWQQQPKEQPKEQPKKWRKKPDGRTLR